MCSMGVYMLELLLLLLFTFGAGYPRISCCNKACEAIRGGCLVRGFSNEIGMKSREEEHGKGVDSESSDDLLS